MRKVSDLKEHLRNTKTVIKMVNQLDPCWLLLCAAGHLLKVAEGYLALILSAYILDALSRGGGFEKIFKVTAVFCGVIFFLSNVVSWLQLPKQRRRLYIRGIMR